MKRTQSSSRFVSARLPMCCLALGLICFLGDQAYGVTGVFLADTHYGHGSTATNQATIDYINALPGTTFPAQVGGGVVGTPRGVMVAGDLTENGTQAQWDLFKADFGLLGENRLNYPVYEGAGNHDGSGSSSPIVTDIRTRNPQRPDVVGISPNGSDYSWDWENVHFVQLNHEATGDTLDFLGTDLTQNVGNSGRPVVLMQHYGWDDFSNGGSWFPPEEKEAMYEVIKDYNIVGIFHGHWHSQEFSNWRGIDIYRIGCTKQRPVDEGRSVVLQIEGDQMIVAGRSGPNWNSNLHQKTIDLPEPASLSMLALGGLALLRRKRRDK